ncbi:hypothetical protein LTR84_001698 [Exophiala bonariae]|uniref:Uncharacterized protein n=1 Tax=Exophiala bonariae TaxID=1690606 RepID=A0AAV9NFS0_9EURO|nr:hypothetical protein LTR84_001698 [Exophiala bonariae]
MSDFALMYVHGQRFNARSLQYDSDDLPENGEELQPDAERQSIYVHNLNSWAVCALLCTVPAHEIGVLRPALYNHLAGGTNIIVKSPPGNPPVYQLAFHLPYYAWRSTTTPRLGAKLEGGDTNMSEAIPAKSLDVSFLAPTKGEKAFMHFAQVSCVVTGVDRLISTVYMFVENEFDDEDSVEHIEQLRNEADYSVTYDPLTRGMLDADQPVADPEALFVLLLRIRMDQINNEYSQIIGKLAKSFENYGPLLTDTHYSLPPTDSYRPSQETALQWVDKISVVLESLRDRLDPLVEAIEGFEKEFHVEIRSLSEYTDKHHQRLPNEFGAVLKELSSSSILLEKMAKRSQAIAERVRIPSQPEPLSMLLTHH